MGFLERQKKIPIAIRDIGDGEAIVISTRAVLETLGELREAVPSHLVRAVGMAMPIGEKAIASLSGRIVRLSDESMRLLGSNEIVYKNGLISGVVRDPSTGRFAGVLSFQRTDFPVSAVSSLPTLAAGVALQMQLARIQQQLTNIEGKLGYVIKQSHLQIEARLLAAVHIVGDVAADVLPSGFVDDDAWDRLSEIEDDVQELRRWSSSNLAPLTHALFNDDVRIGKKVRILRQALDNDQASWWLTARIVSEAALLQWEQLFLMRRAWTTPDELEAVIARVQGQVIRRRDELLRLRNGMEAWLERGSRSERVLDRLRVLQRAHLNRLLAQVVVMVDAYPSALVHAPAPSSLTLLGTGS